MNCYNKKFDSNKLTTLTNLPNVLLYDILSLVINDNLHYYKMLCVNKEFNYFFKNNKIFIDKLLYLNIPQNFIKKNKKYLNSVCIKNLDNISLLDDISHVKSLIISNDKEKQIFSYISKFKSIEFLAVNLNIYDKYIPNINFSLFPDSLKYLYLCGSFSINSIYNFFGNNNNNNLDICVYVCGKDKIIEIKNKNDNDNCCCENDDYKKELKLFNFICEKMDLKLKKKKLKKRSYETYEKHMNIEFYNNYTYTNKKFIRI